MSEIGICNTCEYSDSCRIGVLAACEIYMARLPGYMKEKYDIGGEVK